MKKLFLAASMLMLSVVSFAQSEPGTLTFQPKIGLNVANFSEMDDSDPRVGLSAGAEFEYQLTQLFSLSAGALYSMQGFKATDYTQGVKLDMTFKTDYINIPVLANIYLYKGLVFKFGLQPSFNVRSKYKATALGTTISGDLSDYDVETNTFDLSIPFGLSYEYKNVVLDARYNLGVTKSFEDEDAKNRVFQLTLGYKFRLK